MISLSEKNEAWHLKFSDFGYKNSYPWASNFGSIKDSRLYI